VATDFLLSYHVFRLDGVTQVAGIPTEVEFEHDAVTRKLPNILIYTLQFMELPPRRGKERESASTQLLPANRVFASIRAAYYRKADAQK